MTDTGPAVPIDLSATEYPRLVAILTGDDDAMTAAWTVGGGTYAHLMAGMTGCRTAWQATMPGRTLVVGDFASASDAEGAHDAFHLHEDSWGTQVDGAVAFTKGGDGTLTVLHATHHRVARGVGWGVAAGVLVGVVFPPSVLVGATVLGAGGALGGSMSEGRARDRAQREIGADLAQGASRLVVVVSDHRGD